MNHTSQAFIMRWDMLQKRLQMLSPNSFLKAERPNMTEFLDWQLAMQQWCRDLNSLHEGICEEMER